MWSGSGDLGTDGNGCTWCCGRWPMLRVAGIYAEYRCRECGAKGGRGVTEIEAFRLWESR